MDIKNLEPRLYQDQIFGAASQKNTLAVLPTGLGKTFIALMLAYHRLKSFPGSRIVFMAPTKPLCDQHMRTFMDSLDGISKEDFSLVTGLVRPDERKDLYSKKFVFATPQTISNDIINRNLNLQDISLMVFDEAHRAVGDYDYVFIAKQYMRSSSNPRVLALTASPGSEKSAIRDVCRNLFIQGIEVRNEESEDLQQYTMDKKIEKMMISLPEELKEIKEMFERCLSRRLRILKENGIIQNADLSKVRKSQLLMLQGSFVKKAAGNWYLMKNISVIAACIKIMHCLELLQAQGIGPLRDFLLTLKEQSKKTKAALSLFEDMEFKEAMQRLFELDAKNIEHPKFAKLVDLVKGNLSSKSKIIIFTQYRNTADRIIEFLEKIDGALPVKFIGQKSGMSQKEQIQTVEDFKNNVYNIMVCTSIGEEGLHIENADLGIFFEPVPSALRTIQRRGRIGRVNVGRVVMLITEDTIDEKYFWVSFHKEKRMKDLLKDIKEEVENPQPRLGGFVNGTSD